MAAGHSLPTPIKCRIQNLDGGVGDYVEAYFNPKEVGIEKSVPWNKHKNSTADRPVLEYTDPESRELTIELLFDTFEEKDSVYLLYIKYLEQLTKVIPDKKRPPMVLFTWGNYFPGFMGVISGLSLKYTMFLTDGTPCRATATVKIKEAEALAVKKKKGDSKEGGNYAEPPDPMRPDRYDENHRKVLDSQPEDPYGGD